MTYTAYEVGASSPVLKAVEAHCRHLTGEGQFSPATTPPLARVEQWIDETYYEIYANLAQHGYDPAVPSSATPAVGLLQRLNVFGAVVQVELSHPTTARRGEPNERFMEYAKQYRDGLSILATDALEQMGAIRVEALSAFVELGGRSIGRKQVPYEDTDAVQPRFPRDFGRDPIASQSLGSWGTP